MTELLEGNANSESSSNEESLSLKTDAVNEASKDSLTGQFVPRERFNSMASKFEFSFKPRFMPTNTCDSNFSKSKSACDRSNPTAPKKFSFKPTAMNTPPLRPRDAKASGKSDYNFSVTADPIKKFDDQYPLPKVDIRISSLYDDDKFKQGPFKAGNNL